MRADLVEIATLAHTRTRELARAVDTWREIATRFGEDDECVDALVELLAESGRFAELGELLSQRAGVDRRVHADRLARLGDTLRDAPRRRRAGRSNGTGARWRSSRPTRRRAPA